MTPRRGAGLGGPWQPLSQREPHSPRPVLLSTHASGHLHTPLTPLTRRLFPRGLCKNLHSTLFWGQEEGVELPPETSLANCVATLKGSRAHTVLWSPTPQKGTVTYLNRSSSVSF